MRDRGLVVKTGFSPEERLVPTVNVHANCPSTSLFGWGIDECIRVSLIYACSWKRTHTEKRANGERGPDSAH